MRLEISVPVAAPADALWAWWTDFGQPGQSFRVRHGPVTATRRVHENAGGRVVLEDGFGPLGAKREVQVHADARFMSERPLDRGMSWASTWRFERLGEHSSRVSRVVEVHGAQGKLAGLAPGVLERLVRKDLEAHVAEFEREHRENAAAKGP